jgi:hypothetical protein
MLLFTELTDGPPGPRTVHLKVHSRGGTCACGDVRPKGDGRKEEDKEG